MSKIYDDDEKKSLTMFDLGDRLFDDKHLLRHTQILHPELPMLNVLRTLGKLQDKYREKYLGVKEDCTLTKLVNDNLRLRTSIKGWRSNQTVEMIKTSFPQVQQQQDNPIGQIVTAKGNAPLPPVTKRP